MKTKSKMAVEPARHEDAQIRILRFLWKTRNEWSGREISREVRLSAPACHDALKKLNARGLVLFRHVSNVHLYKINPDNYLVQHVFARQFQAERDMPQQIETAIKRTLVSDAANILSLVIFGSMARGTNKPDSDLDLLVVLPTKDAAKGVEERLERLRSLLSRRFSVPLSPYVQALSELRHKHDTKLPLIGEILKDGRTIYGKDLKEMLHDR